MAHHLGYNQGIFHQLIVISIYISRLKPLGINIHQVQRFKTVHAYKARMPCLHIDTPASSTMRVLHIHLHTPHLSLPTTGE